ncbi:MFS transporter [Priestia koreensis]|uniref:MFS transporter n=1 Tax=Priestia koreensis TaxID=284581 RepID=UPI001F5711F1|nr:MFS transporter [Priestia koreensis]
MSKLEKNMLPSKKKFITLPVYLTLPIVSWALYDFANTIFSSNISTIFFPFYLEETVGSSEAMKQLASTFISYANALASVFLVIFSPLYGTMIDRTKRKKKPLVYFALGSIICTFGMGVAAYQKQWDHATTLPLSLILVVILFVLAKFFFQSSLVFYDSMMPDLGSKEQMPLISGFGVAIGYFGTLVGLSVYFFVGDHDFHRAFIPTAILYLLFSLPIIFLVKEPPQHVDVKEKQSFFSGYKEIYQTFQEMRAFRSIFLFMITYFFINDAIATAIAMMAVYAKAVIGFTTSGFILLYLISTVASIIGAFVFGYVVKKFTSRHAVTMVGVILVVALIFAVTANGVPMFWVAGSLFGVSLGSMWVATRTFIIELSPENKRGQFFGLFAFSGKLSAIVGPLLYGTITWALKDYGALASRIALASLLLLAGIGLWVHLKTRYETVQK